MSASLDILRDLLPPGSVVTPIDDEGEPEAITDYRMTKLHGPMVRLSSHWYFLHQICGGWKVLEEWHHILEQEEKQIAICLTCPLPECLGIQSPKCPIYIQLGRRPSK